MRPPTGFLAFLSLVLTLMVACAPAAAPSPTAAPPKPTAAPKPAAGEEAPAPKAEAPAPKAPPPATKPAAQAGAPGYLFFASHDEIVAKARTEGALRALVSLDPEAIKAVRQGFSQKYPFIKFDLQEITGSKEAEKFLLELKAGVPQEWDSAHLNTELYKEYPPYVEKVDLLGMAEQRILQIVPKMVDPNHRSIVSVGTAMAGFTYNKKQLSAEKAPKTWEDFLKSEFKGRKFVVDIEPSNLATLVPLKGEAWVLDYAKKLAAQEPIWARGDSRALAALGAGEYALHFASNYHSAMRARDKVPDVLEVVVPDPVPVRLTEPMAILKGAKHPAAALLFYEYLASPEGQKILDDIEPLKSSIYAPGSKLEQAVRGKQVSIIDWEHMEKRGSYTQKIVGVWGFPSAEIK